MATVLLIIHLMIAARADRRGAAAALRGRRAGHRRRRRRLHDRARGAANLLTRVTAGLAAAFFATSLLLSILATRTEAPRSILDEPAARCPASRAGSAGAPAASAGAAADRPEQPPAQPEAGGRRRRARGAAVEVGCSSRSGAAAPRRSYATPKSASRPAVAATGSAARSRRGRDERPWMERKKPLFESAASEVFCRPMARYIFITGGVVSSLGKGLASAALGALLQARGYTVRLRKLDPYLNVDPGTMSPYQHGEVFVTDDGAETDLDLGHYERFTGVPAKQVRQHHHRPHLPGHPRQGAARRLPGRHRAGDPARHRRHQGVRPVGQRGARLRAGGDRRHGRRHRGPAVLRGHPPARQRAAARRLGVHPPDADAVHPERRRAEDQADAALGEGAALDRHPARHPAVPLRPRRCRRPSARRSRCSATCAPRR